MNNSQKDRDRHKCYDHWCNRIIGSRVGPSVMPPPQAISHIHTVSLWAANMQALGYRVNQRVVSSSRKWWFHLPLYHNVVAHHLPGTRFYVRSQEYETNVLLSGNLRRENNAYPIQQVLESRPCLELCLVTALMRCLRCLNNLPVIN